MPEESEEVMGIIADPVFGVEDHGFCGLRFIVHTLHHSTLQMLDGELALDFLRRNSVADTRQLQGKPCRVRTEGGFVRFIDLWRP